MSEREQAVAARLATAHQLSSVVTAMRGLAAARTREAQARLDGIRSYAAIIGSAIGEALALAGDGRREPDPAGGGIAVIALCAEQGFAGAFSARVLDAVVQIRDAGPDGRFELLLVGDRGLSVAEEKGLSVAWSAPMIAHVAQVPALADDVADAIYERLRSNVVGRVTMVHAVPGEGARPRILATTLAPFDLSRFDVPTTTNPPRIEMAPAELLLKLADEYVFAELCEALTLSFAAENEARMRAMIDARTSLDRMQTDLEGLARRLRQEGITAEIVELASAAALRRRHADEAAGEP